MMKIAIVVNSVEMAVTLQSETVAVAPSNKISPT